MRKGKPVKETDSVKFISHCNKATSLGMNVKWPLSLFGVKSPVKGGSLFGFILFIIQDIDLYDLPASSKNIKTLPAVHSTVYFHLIKTSPESVNYYSVPFAGCILPVTIENIAFRLILVYSPKYF